MPLDIFWLDEFCGFVLTGYGDLHPVNEREIIITVVLILSTIISVVYTGDDMTKAKQNGDAKGDSDSAVHYQVNTKRTKFALS